MQTRGQGPKAPLKKTYELDDTPEKDNSSYDKENAVNATTPGRSSKRKGDRRGKKGLSKRLKTGKTPSASQESPPAFEFKAAKTPFSKRKALKLQKQREETEKNKKRIDELVAYFKNLDEQKLETA